MQFYLIKKDLNFFSVSSEWQLQKNSIIKDVGTNMFIAKTVADVAINKWQQLDQFEGGLVKLLIENNAFLELERMT